MTESQSNRYQDFAVKFVFAVGVGLAICFAVPFLICDKLNAGVRRGAPSWARSR